MTETQAAETGGQTRHDFGLGPLLLDEHDDDGLMPAHAASTLIIYHDAPDSAASPILMVRRSAAMKFAAGAAVFPGGRVDDDDRQLAGQLAPHLLAEDAAARIAAIRETLEETGLGIGIRHDGGTALLAQWRQRLHDGELFSALLEEAQAALDMDQLQPFSRWRPNFEHSRLFDTRFYVSKVTGDVPDVTTNSGENTHHFWVRPQEALEQAAAGQMQLIFPTRRILERLAQFDGHDAVVQSTQSYPSRRIIPFIADINGETYLCIRDDCGYPVTCEPVSSALR